MTGLRLSHCSSPGEPTLAHNNQAGVKIHIKKLDKVSGIRSHYREVVIWFTEEPGVYPDLGQPADQRWGDMFIQEQAHD